MKDNQNKTQPKQLAEYLQEIVKANDVRAVVPKQFNEVSAYSFGKAWGKFLTTKNETTTYLGHDIRLFGTKLSNAFAFGVLNSGVSVIDIGLCSTDQMNFASGEFNLSGAMITASHNPSEYNGIKFMECGAKPVGEQNGLSDIVKTVKKVLENSNSRAVETLANSKNIEKYLTNSEFYTTCQMQEKYAQKMKQLCNLEKVKPLKIVVDAGNAMGGLIAPVVFNQFKQIEIVPLYFELDGSFPNHQPNPLDFNNLKDLQKEVIKNKANLGLAFDGDADRCFMVDEKGEIINPSAIICAIASEKISQINESNSKKQNINIVHNLITSKVVPDTVKLLGATPVVERVGHSFIKARMRKLDAVFGGEHSAHYYFKEFYYADSGMLAALNFIKYMDKHKRKASEISFLYNPYFQSGEINTKVENTKNALNAVQKAFEPDIAAKCVVLSELDGLMITNIELNTQDWWVSVRSSQTEPLLRLNVEAETPEVCQRLTQKIQLVINEFRQN